MNRWQRGEKHATPGARTLLKRTRQKKLEGTLCTPPRMGCICRNSEDKLRDSKRWKRGQRKRWGYEKGGEPKENSKYSLWKEDGATLRGGRKHNPSRASRLTKVGAWVKESKAIKLALGTDTA